MLDGSQKPTTLFSVLKYHSDDEKIILCMTLPIIIVWISLFFNKSFFKIFSNVDSGPYIAVAKHLYILENETIAKASNQTSANKTIISAYLPTTPVIMKILSKICFGSWSCASLIYCLTFSALSGILFSRFLSLVSLSKNPIQAGCLFGIIPLRFLYYRSIVVPDSLYVCLFFSIFISIRIKDYRAIFFSILLATLTMDRAIFSISGFLIFYFIREKFSFSWRLFKPWGIGMLILSLFSKFTTGNFFSFLVERYRRTNQFFSLPFIQILYSCLSIGFIEQFHSLFMYLCMIAVGITLLPYRQLPLIFTLIAAIIYSSMIKYEYDIFRSGPEIEALVIFGCFDIFIQDVRFQKMIPLFSILYSVFNIIYTTFLIQGRGYSENILNVI